MSENVEKKKNENAQKEEDFEDAPEEFKGGWYVTVEGNRLNPMLEGQEYGSTHLNVKRRYVIFGRLKS
jgi:hypothetical protein